MKEDEGLLTALKREPDQAWFLGKVSLGGAIAIVGWSYISDSILPPVAGLVVLMLLILAYAGCLTYLIARLVRSMDRWQVESAKQASRLATTRRHVDRSASERALPPPMPQATFQQAYFLLRLSEEVKEARRTGSTLSLIAIDVNVPQDAMSAEVAENVNFELAHIAADHSRMISVPLSTGETEVMFCLPNVDVKGARTFVSNLVQALGKYWCHFGVVTYPGDGTDGEMLFNRAREACEMSRQDREPENRPQTESVA